MKNPLSREDIKCERERVVKIDEETREKLNDANKA